VLTDWTVVADTKPPKTLMPWVVAEVVEAIPVEMASDEAYVSTVPVVSSPGT
jgi:hypothetical protein